MMQMPNYKTVKTFDWPQLNKKIGQIIVSEPTDSDLQEGQSLTQVWFIEEDSTMWLLAEKGRTTHEK